jgi:glycosyltransferase involved in cell wall biosynthesis
LKYFYPKLPFIITLQEGKNLQEQGLLINFFRKLILKKADRTTAISRYLRNYILEINKNLKVDIIPNGVDVGYFSRSFSYGELTDLENELGIKPDDKVIISVSRLVYKNGPDLLIDAFDILNSKFNPPTGGQNYKLLIIGDGPLKESLKFQVKSLKLEDRVILAGSVGQEKLPMYLKISDIFVRPSRSEGLGSAFLEAMAAEVPVIGTKVGGIPDFLENRKTGLFCSGEPEDIAFKIRILLENDKLREELVSNARALVAEKYNWDKIAVEFDKLYKSYK